MLDYSNMARKTKKEQKNFADLQPDEINDLRRIVLESTGKDQSLEDEIALLKEDQKELVEEYSDRIDMKTLKSVIRIIKIESKIAHKDTADLMMDALKDPSQ